jgi:predicted RNase H-like HicB family nuclease
MPSRRHSKTARTSGSVIESAHTYRSYVFTIRYAPKDRAYTVDFPDVREIITSGDTLPKAFENACEALDLHLESLQKLGRKQPGVRCRMVMQSA